MFESGRTTRPDLGDLLTSTLATRPAPSLPAINRSRAADGHQRRVPWALVLLAVVTAAGLALRLYRLRYGYAHASTGYYDDGAYLGSAVSLSQGHLPYRDFVFVQPPAIAELMLPVAALAKVIGTAQAMGLAKILTGLAGAASVPLTAKLVWHRGPRIALLAAVVVAVQGDAVASAFALLLEPWVVLLLLAGFTLVFRAGDLASGRRLWWGGVLLGLACATKIWAIVPVVLLALVVWRARAGVRRYGLGVAVGFLVPVLPLALPAPGAFVREVFVAQAVRTAPERTGLTYRLVHLFSVGPPDGSLPTASGWLLVGVFALLAAGGLAWLSARTRAQPLDRFVGLTTLGVVAMLLIPCTFYWHYAAFAVPFVALTLALPVSRLGPRSALAWTTGLVIWASALAALTINRDLRDYAVPDDHVALARVVPAGSCVVTTVAAATLVDDRYLSTRPDCPPLVDPFGTALVYGDGRLPEGALDSPALARVWIDAYKHADFVLLRNRTTPTVPTTRGVDAYLHRHFHVVRVPGLLGELWARN